MPFKLSKAGYGTPEEILKMNGELALLALQYENFLSDYEEEFMRLNNQKE